MRSQSGSTRRAWDATANKTTGSLWKPRLMQHFKTERSPVRRASDLAITAAHWLFASHFMRFAVVGTGGFTVDESMLALFHYGLGIDPYTSRAMSIAIGATFTWWGNRTLTFRAHAARGSVGAIIREWAQFMAANAVGALVNYGIYFVLVTWGTGVLRNPLIATIAGVAVGLFFNFTLSKHLVFRATSPKRLDVPRSEKI